MTKRGDYFEYLAMWGWKAKVRLPMERRAEEELGRENGEIEEAC